MAHIQESYTKLYRPESTHDKVDSQKMFIDNIDILESLFSMLKAGTLVSPDDIGALPKYKTCPELTGNNANNTLVFGAYRFDTKKDTNLPPMWYGNDSAYGTLITIPWDGSTVGQIAIRYNMPTSIAFRSSVIANAPTYWNDWVEGANKIGGFTIMNESHLTIPVANCNTINELVSQMPDKSILYAYTWSTPSWYPQDISPSMWMLKVFKLSQDSVFLELDNCAASNKHYKAGYSHGTTFTGWDKMNVTSAVVPATVVE